MVRHDPGHQAPTVWDDYGVAGRLIGVPFGADLGQFGRGQGFAAVGVQLLDLSDDVHGPDPFTR